MRTFLSLLFCVFFIQAQAQENPNNKGRLYFFWGWNHSAYSNSDIHFHGNNFNFTLKDVVAKDRQTKDLKEYFDPGTLTIPQYNMRLGYFITDRLSVSVGNDHMKYVVQPWQVKKIDGWINGTGSIYDGVYQNQDIEFNPIFIRFEHTDGLNYENFDVRWHEELKVYGQFYLDGFVGAGSGILLPKTNVTLLQRPRYDEFNVAGFGVHSLTGLTLSYQRKVFIQCEAKGGYMNMSNIRISQDASEGAKQTFYFFEYDIVFGVSLPIVNTN